MPWRCQRGALGLVISHSGCLLTSLFCEDNVLIFIGDNGPIAKLCDFGLSRIEEEEPSGLTTSTYHGKGTVAYLSPELVISNTPKRDAKSDIWAWGCVVLEVRVRPSLSRTPFIDARHFNSLDHDQQWSLFRHQERLSDCKEYLAI